MHDPDPLIAERQEQVPGHLGSALRRLAVMRQLGRDTLLVTKLDRLARSVPDARAIADELAAGIVALSLGGAVHDPTDPVGRLLFNALAMVAEFERDLISQRTREGMAIARQRGRLKGKMPKLKPAQEQHLVKLFDAGDHTIAELTELFGVGRATVYRAVDRARRAEIQRGGSDVAARR